MQEEGTLDILEEMPYLRRAVRLGIDYIRKIEILEKYR